MSYTIQIIAVSKEEGKQWLYYTDQYKYKIVLDNCDTEEIKKELNGCPYIRECHAVLFVLDPSSLLLWRWDRISNTVAIYSGSKEDKHKIDPHMVVKEELNYLRTNSTKETIDPNPPKAKPNLAEEAIQLIYGDREQTHGRPDLNLQTIADFWTTYIREKEVLTVDDVCNMMNLLKVARSKSNPGNRDNDLDSIGYILLKERISEYRRTEPASKS